MRLLAFVMLLGCSKSGPSCAEQALELDRFLTGIDHQQSMLGFSSAHLVTRDDLPASVQSYGPSVQIEAHRFIIDGRLVSYDELGEALVAKHAYVIDELERRGRGRAGSDPQLLYLVIDEAAPWDAVVAVTETAAHAGFTTPAFVFARTATVKPPPRSAVDDQLDKIQSGDDASSKATELAKLIQDVIKPCPALMEAFGKVAATEVDDKAGYIIQQVQPALVDCECKVDIPSLRSALWRMLANTKPTTEVRLTLDRAASPITLPAKTPWREAAKQLKPGAATGWLVVRP
jgi:hypothetical protein